MSSAGAPADAAGPLESVSPPPTTGTAAAADGEDRVVIAAAVVTLGLVVVGAVLVGVTGTHSDSLMRCWVPLETGNCERSCAACVCFSCGVNTGSCLAFCTHRRHYSRYTQPPTPTHTGRQDSHYTQPPTPTHTVSQDSCYTQPPTPTHSKTRQSLHPTPHSYTHSN